MAELIPRRVLFGNPERISPHLSPDGTRLAWIAPQEGVLNVWAAPLGTNGVDWSAARVVTDDTDRGIRMFAWAHDAQHLLYLQDTGGDENWRLHDVDLAAMQPRGPAALAQGQTEPRGRGQEVPDRDPDRAEPRQPPAARRLPAEPDHR